MFPVIISSTSEHRVLLEILAVRHNECVRLLERDVFFWTHTELQHSACQCTVKHQCSDRWCQCGPAQHPCWRRCLNASRRTPQRGRRSGSGTDASGHPSCLWIGFLLFAYTHVNTHTQAYSGLFIQCRGWTAQMRDEERSSSVHKSLSVPVINVVFTHEVYTALTWAEPQVWLHRWVTLCS